jgi:hypothetical protein
VRLAVICFVLVPAGCSERANQAAPEKASPDTAKAGAAAPAATERVKIRVPDMSRRLGLG